MRGRGRGIGVGGGGRETEEGRNGGEGEDEEEGDRFARGRTMAMNSSISFRSIMLCMLGRSVRPMSAIWRPSCLCCLF